MVTQAYHESGNFDLLYRSPYRSMSNHYYEPNEPYTQYGYHHRQSNRSEYPGRHSARALVHATGTGGPHGQTTRKRIGLACTRCRKRKIKCSGDIDGSGCQACKAQGSEGVTCTFNRVGSDVIQPFEDYLTNTQPPTSQDVAYDMDPITSTMNGPVAYHSLGHCQSLPTLQTRSTGLDGYDSYTTSPVEGYGYSSYSAPRNDSFHSTFDGGFRSWSNANMLSPASAIAIYDRSPGHTFGSISTPSFPAMPQQHQQNTRLPSMTSESFSALNMGHLYTSLPTQTVQSRRLPIPQMTPSYEQPPYSGPELPEIRPLPEPKTRLSSVHSRVSAPWPRDAGYFSHRNGSSLSLAPPLNGAMHSVHSSSVPLAPVVRYHYNSANETSAELTTQSPSASPTAGPSTSFSYTAAPSYETPMTPVSYGTYYGLPPITTSHYSDACSSRWMKMQPTTSYSFNSNTATAGSTDRTSSDDSSNAMRSTYASYPTICHPQPHHVGGTEALRRQASFDSQQQRTAASTQRISISDLSSNGPAHSAA